MNRARVEEPDFRSVPDEISLWEAAYLRFETPQQEIRKFESRLRRLGADDWPRDAQIVEIFCGRGNGLRALHNLGFTRLEGIDLSPALASIYDGPGTVVVGDCRQLPLKSHSRDVLIVQGGLHHLPVLPGDLDQTLADVARVLRPTGRFVVVEPWRTLFLHLTHLACASRVLRAASPKVDALATMIQYERATYECWLGQPREILDLLHYHFEAEQESTNLGKLMFVGRPRRRQ